MSKQKDLRKETLAETLTRIKESGRWLLRLSNDGTSSAPEAKAFKWSPVGEWTEAKDWDPTPVCGGGLHGQGPEGVGHCGKGTRIELCETGPDRVVVDGNKVKARMARIIAINDEALMALEILCPDGFKGALNLSGYTHPLPAGFTSCGGDLYLEGYTHPLPAGFTSCGGYLNLRGYTHPLPAGFTSCGGYLYLRGYTHPLPAGFTSCGGDLYLRGYTHPLPAGLVVKGRVRK